MKLLVKIKPAAKESRIVGWLGTVLKINIAAKPIKGQANEELITFLSKKLNLAKNKIQIISGKTDRVKIVDIETDQDVLKELMK